MKHVIYSLLALMTAIAANASASFDRPVTLGSTPLIPSVATMEKSGLSSPYDNAAIKCAKWILSVNISDNDDESLNNLREEASEFLLTWMDMTDKVHVTLGHEIYPLLENKEILVAYLAGAAIYAVENQTSVYDHSMKIHSLGVAISYYQANKSQLGVLTGMDYLIKLRDTGKLDYYLTEIAPMLSEALPSVAQRNIY